MNANVWIYVCRLLYIYEICEIWIIMNNIGVKLKVSNNKNQKLVTTETASFTTNIY